MSKLSFMDILKWRFVTWRLRRAIEKRDTLIDDAKIDALDERIWALKGKNAGYLLKSGGEKL